jgi:Na+/phosphate symporter
MEEKEMTEMLHSLFEEMIQVLHQIRKGFFAQKGPLLRENLAKLREILKSRVGFVEKLVGQRNKNEVMKKYLNLIPSLQVTASALENLAEKMAIKVESHILLSEKAVKEIEHVFGLILDQHRDAKDLVLTKNPHLKHTIKEGKEKIIRAADEYSLVHEERLIMGICMPKASYLYLDIIESFKRIARGVNDFAEKV